MEVWNWTPNPKAILKHPVNHPVLKTLGTMMQQRQRNRFPWCIILLIRQHRRSSNINS